MVEFVEIELVTGHNVVFFLYADTGSSMMINSFHSDENKLTSLISIRYIVNI